MMRSAALTLLLLATAVQAAPPARIDACALLDDAQVASAVDAPVDAGRLQDYGVEDNGAWSSSCVWTLTAAAGTPMGARGFVILNAMRWPAGSGRAHEFLDTFHEAAAAGVLAEPAAREFGDAALWWGDGLAVARRDVSFGLSVHLPQARVDVPGAREERLAPLVLRRIDADAGAAASH